MKLYLETNDVIQNGLIQYTVICFSEKMNCNVAILKRDTYCPYVVAHDIYKEHDGTYCWRWGHYYNYLENAYKKYEELILKYLR